MLTHPLRRFVAACASVLLVLGLVSLTSSPSQAADGEGLISGWVTDAEGVGQFVPVSIFKQNGDTWDEVRAEVDAEAGYYDVSLPPGTYKVGFNLPSEGWRREAFAPEYFNDAQTLETAEPITVTAGSTRSGVNAQLGYSGGAISGTVTDIEGKPLSYVEIYAYATATDFDDGMYSFRTVTDELGHYTLHTRGKPIKVQFYQDSGGYLSELFDDAVLWADAPFLSAPIGVDIPNVDAELAPAPLVNYELPQIHGDLFDGGTARAYEGDWSTRTAAFTYEWFREGTVNPIATGKTYKVSSFSVGKRLTVRVTAHQVGTPDVQATSLPSARVKRASYLGLYATSPAKLTAKFTVTLRFTGVRYPSGKVRVTCSGLWATYISVYKGRGTGTLKVPSGYRNCKAVYTGTSTVAGDTAYRAVYVK